MPTDYDEQPSSAGRTPTAWSTPVTASLDNTIGWDRGELLPRLREANGDMAVTMVLAHEYGHAVQHQAKLNDEGHPDAGRRAAGRLSGRRVHALGGRGQLPAVHAEHRRRAEQPAGGDDFVPRPAAVRGRLRSADDNEHGSAFERISASSSASPTARRRARRSTTRRSRSAAAICRSSCSEDRDRRMAGQPRSR